jgi:hypothetical protein
LKTIKKKKSAFLVLAVLILCISLILVIFASSHVSQSSSPKNLDTAIGDAIKFFEDSNQPHALLWLDVMYRRFGVTEFAYAAQRYDQILDERSNIRLFNVFRRIIHHDNQLQPYDMQAVVEAIDLITVPALYCNRPDQPLPENYPLMLDQAAKLGGYNLTHVVLALIWIQDNGCEVPLPAGFIDQIYLDNSALINDGTVIDELKIEAAAFLYLAGQGELVDDSFIERVIEVQNTDGGWLRFSDVQDGSNWHTTISALLLLLHVKYPADSYPPVLAPPTP